MLFRSLGVAHDDVGDAELVEHGGGDLTGVGAVVVDRHVLGAVLDVEGVSLDDRLIKTDIIEN